MGAGVGGWLGCPRRAHRRAGDGGGGGWRWADGNCKSESASTGWNRGVLGPLGGVSGHPSSAPPPQPFCDRGILSIRTARCMNTIMAMQAANKESSLYCAGAAATCACGGGAARGGRRESTEPATGQPPLSPQAPSRLPRQLHGPPADVNSVAATRVVAAVALTAAAYGAAHCTRPPPPLLVATSCTARTRPRRPLLILLCFACAFLRGAVRSLLLLSAIQSVVWWSSPVAGAVTPCSLPAPAEVN